ncbi:MAG: ADP-ribosylglycohydrolase family protein, partial [Deltaproteobacteria bacterium]
MSEAIHGRIRGCLLAGAVGDALGAPIEFASRKEIRERHGPDGVRDYAPAYGRRGAITDDTQMSLFTAEGLVLATRAGSLHRPAERLRHLHRAHLRWLRTQAETSRSPSFDRCTEGWLLDVEALHARRAPGTTCLTALRCERMGRLEHPLNHSKGCGGVMRVAPVGLALGVDDPFRLGCEVAALTHGHPSGQLAAGFLARAVRELVCGADLESAFGEALEELVRQPQHAECARAVETAMARARGADLRPETVEKLGAGWLAEEALAIAVYCALAARDVERGLRLAVNHGGDSDSTGSLTGNLLGAARGETAIPGRWLAHLELRDEIERAADALF